MCGSYSRIEISYNSKSRIIYKIAKSLGLKISKIGKICSSSQKSHIIDEKGEKIALKYKGYYHNF